MGTWLIAATGILLTVSAGPAEARHYPCAWNPSVSVDDSDPDVVRVSHGGLNALWCPFGGVHGRVAGAGHALHVHADGGGLHWEIDPPPPAGAPSAESGPPQPVLRLAITPRRAREGRRTPFLIWANWSDDLEADGVVVRFSGRRIQTDRRGFAVVRARLRPGRHQAVATIGGERLATAVVRVQRRRPRAR